MLPINFKAMDSFTFDDFVICCFKIDFQIVDIIAQPIVIIIIGNFNHVFFTYLGFNVVKNPFFNLTGFPLYI